MPDVTTHLDRLFQAALQRHQAGRLAEAEQLYRQILGQQPNHVEALHLLGVLATQVGKNDIAVTLIRQAIRVRPDFPEAHYNLGNVLITMGHANEAIAAYRQAISFRPDHPESHCNLGNVLQAIRQPNDAIVAYRHAISLRPNFPEAYNNLGNALRATGQLDEAIAAYRQAIKLRSSYPDAYNNLGTALKEKGRLDEAIAAFRQAIALNANFPDAYNNLGGALKDKGQLDDAIAACRQVIAVRPNYSEAYNNLGIALLEIGRPDEAVAACQQAVALRPSLPEAHYNLGKALHIKGRLDQASAAYCQAIALRPDYPEAHNSFGWALYGKGQLDEAIIAYRQAIALKADYSEAHTNLGSALKEKGQLDEAIAAYRRATVLKPDSANARSNLVLTLNYMPGFNASAIAEEASVWNRQHAQPLRQFIQPHCNDRTSNRRLRIGYVSADFRDHCCALFLDPLLRTHDRSQFEIFCYSQVAAPDEMTSRFQSICGNWRSTVGLTDERVADLVREDAIDILVDLKLHTDNNRLLVFARKPAPVLVTWLGYPGSTGMDVIDYRLSDPYLDPQGIDTSIYSEETIRLPNTFWCYDPLAVESAVNPLPALTAGHITFGCLNNFCKVNDQVLELWSRVLRAIDRSRLLLRTPEGSARESVVNSLQRQGVHPDRLEFVPPLARPQYLELYHRIDVGLDTFPYNGHTTSLDSFWMGVPVVTLVGQTIVGRAGLSQLMNLNLPELIAQTPEKYIEIAAGLANDLPRLAQLRSELRRRMQQSPLMDASQFARDIEEAYRHMWVRWCLGQS